jgi:hypothetical protein
VDARDKRGHDGGGLSVGNKSPAPAPSYLAALNFAPLSQLEGRRRFGQVDLNLDLRGIDGGAR